MLDEFEAAHALVGGTPAARRFARQQIAQAYVVLLCSQFQRFCRELHIEATESLTHLASHDPIAAILRRLLSTGKRLDIGNPNSATLGADFGRLGMDFWGVLRQRDPRNNDRKAELDVLMSWRNAIAHQDFRNAALGGAEEVDIRQVRRWRRACERLAVEFDAAIRLYLRTTTGVTLW
ncbi:MAG TPA: hypothetical protein VF705_14825 [Longimicrobium sp.]